MCRKLIYLASFALLVIAANAQVSKSGVPIPIANHSFEAPPGGKQVGTVPTGWTIEGSDYGIEGIYSDGLQSAFLGFGGSIFQLLDYTVAANDQYTLTFDALKTWPPDGTATYEGWLYYDDNGVIVKIASVEGSDSEVSYPETPATWTEYTLSYTVKPDDPFVGKKLGVLFTFTGPSGMWVAFDNIRLENEFSLKAWGPYPLDANTIGTTDVELQWNPGAYVANVSGHRVYFDPCEANIQARSGCQINGEITSDPFYTVTSLSPGETYYWAIDEVNDLHPDKLWPGDLWSFTVQVKTASNPTPADGAQRVLLDIKSLEWDPGVNAQSHDVYFGTSYNDTYNATDPGVSPGQGTVIDPCWPVTPSPLEPNTTYYWRVDEFDGTTLHKGDVWSFTTTLAGLGTITRELYLDIPGDAVADLTDYWKYPDYPDQIDKINAFNFWGLGVDNFGSRTHGWLYPPAEGDYTFWICSDNGSELWLSTDETTENAVLIAQVPNDNWTGRYQWDKFPEDQNSLSYHGPITLEGNKRYYIMALQKEGSEWDGVVVSWQGPAIPARTVITGGYLQPFESLQAWGPKPANHATDVRRDPTFSWVSGMYAAMHDVYFGTDFQAVSSAGRDNDPLGVLVSRNQTANTYNPGTLNFNTTYYWRVDEVNDVHPDKLWKGNVWSFTVGNFLVVDDFEDYNDVDNKIFDTWVDYFINNTGMTVGHLEAPFAERSIVHSGFQSMYMRYDNDGTVNEGTDYEKSGTLTFSETERTWDTPQDWTREGATSLTLWFRGIPASVGSFTIAPPITMTGSGADIWGTADQFHFAYKRLSGVGSITAKVVSMTNTHNSAKAGVMIRESLEPDAAHTMVDIQPMNEVQFLRRTQTEAESEADGQGQISAPVWVRLTRSGNTFTGEYSVDKNNWEMLGSATIPMLADVYIGLIVCSHDNNATCIAEFSDVTTTGSVTGDWQSQDIGINSNVAEPLYVAVEDSAGNNAVVKHPDPAVTVLSTWTEWNIPLTPAEGGSDPVQGFALAGVNLKAIKKMSISVGNRVNPQAGSSGTLYIDDIWLKLPLD